MRRVLSVTLLLAVGARAQEEPTPFWMPPPPPSKKAAPAKPGKKPAKKKPVQVEPAAPPPIAVPSPEQPRAPAARAPTPPIGEPVPAAPARPLPSAPPGVATPEVPGPEQPAAFVVADPEPQPQPEEARRWSVDAYFGAWGKSRSDGVGRDWQLAYGLRLGRALLPALELEIELLRAGGSAGSPFVSASATHNLAALRAFWVCGGAGGVSHDRYALLLGGGGGVALSQTHYTLQPSTDPAVIATGLDANAVKRVIEITAAARARIVGGLEVRAEVSAAVRDGKLEFLPLLAAGAAF